MSAAENKAVFLSYASQDAEAARRICDALRAAGVEVWFDADGGLEHGDEWDAKIRQQIKECVLFLPIISANTESREEGYFRLEWDLAAERARTIATGVAFILPILIDDTREAAALVPDRFRAVQWTRLRGGEVTPEVRARFLKLWSHRIGAAKAELGARASSPALSPEAGGTPALPGRRIPTAAWLAAAAALAVVLALGGFALWWQARMKTPATASTAAPAVPARPAAEKTLAVLAFANLSDDRSNDSFSDSISEELLNVLAKTPGLRVTARTSAFHFKGKDAPVPEIARQLGVEFVVEGSVRRSGDRVRITAQLIKAGDGFRVWSETFTRDFKDVFALQDEIAAVVAQNLQLKLGLRVADRPVNAEAYALYLEAGRAWALRDPTNLDRAEALLTRALALEPQFPRAFALMALVLTQRSNGAVLTAPTDADRTLFAQVQTWADRALAAAPHLAEAHTAHGSLLDRLGRWAEGKAAYRRAIELDPTYPTAHQWYGRSLMADGEVDESLAELRRAAELDPLAPRILDNFAGFSIYAGRVKEGRAFLDRVAALGGEGANEVTFRAHAFLLLNQPAEAIKLVAPLAERLETRMFPLVTLAQALIAAGRRTEAEALLSLTGVDSFYRGAVLCALGRHAEGIPLLRPTANGHRLLFMFYFQLLPRDDAEFLRRLEEWGLRASWERIVAWRRKNTPEVFNSPPPATPAPVARGGDKSIAVLAFANLSGDKENEYFSDGISEELLNVLARVPGLTVRGRSSGFYFKGRPAKSSEIGEHLAVNYLVQGSVRRAGERVRISAQLIRAATDEIVWSSGSLDRELKDIFAIQDEIAQLIAQNMELKLAGRAVREVNPEAHRLVLEGRHYLALRGEPNFLRSEQAFRRAAEIAPQMGVVYEGWAELAAQRGRYQLLAGQDVLASQLSEVQALASRALQLEPSLAGPHAALSVAYVDAGRLDEAEAATARGLAANPNYGTLHHWHGHVHAARGRIDLALETAVKATELDPLSFIALYIRGAHLLYAGRPAEALPSLERAAQLRAERFLPLEDERALAHALLGRHEEALVIARRILDDPGLLTHGWWGVGEALWVLRQGGADEEAARRGAALLARLDSANYLRGYILCALGRAEEGIPFLRRAPTLARSRTFYSPALEVARATPAYRRLLEEWNWTAQYGLARATVARLQGETQP